VFLWSSALHDYSENAVTLGSAHPFLAVILSETKDLLWLGLVFDSLSFPLPEGEGW
jgi:hypothetical protein